MSAYLTPRTTEISLTVVGDVPRNNLNFAIARPLTARFSAHISLTIVLDAGVAVKSVGILGSGGVVGHAAPDSIVPLAFVSTA